MRRPVGRLSLLLVLVGCAGSTAAPSTTELEPVALGRVRLAAPAFLFEGVSVRYQGSDGRRLEFEASSSSGGATAEGLASEAADGARALGMEVERLPGVRLGGFRARAFRAIEDVDGVPRVRLSAFAMPTPWRRVALLLEGPAADYGDGVVFRALLDSVVLGGGAGTGGAGRSVFGVASLEAPPGLFASDLLATGSGYRLRVALGEEPRRRATGELERMGARGELETEHAGRRELPGGAVLDEARYTLPRRDQLPLFRARVGEGDAVALIVLSPTRTGEPVQGIGLDVWSAVLATVRAAHSP